MRQLLTISDLAERYGVTRQSIYNWRKSGKLPNCILIGQSRRWNITDIEAFEQALTNNQKGEITE